MSDLTLIYAVTPTQPYVRYAAASIYSALRSNPTVRIALCESAAMVPDNPATGKPYPEALHVNALCELTTAERSEAGSSAVAVPSAFSLLPSSFAVLMDADTWVHGDLRELLPGEGDDVSLRTAHPWTTGQIDRNGWHDICDYFEIPRRKVWANGVIACTAVVMARLGPAIRNWMRALPTCNLPYPVHLQRREDWWMLDQLALSAAVAGFGWHVRELGAEHFSRNFSGEKGGIIHHLGKNTDPFNPKFWERSFR